MKKKRFPRHAHSLRPLVLLCTLVGLSACSRVEHADLVDYVNDLKATPPGRITPLPEFETYKAFTYQAYDLRDPFVPSREATLADSARVDNGLRPPVNRNPEALESFPLDALKFIGQMEKQGSRWAIVQAPDGLVHPVQVGNHLGQNYGEITGFNESQIAIREIIPDGLGGWIYRDAAIALTE